MNPEPSNSGPQDRQALRYERAQYERTPIACLLVAVDRIERFTDLSLRDVLRTAVDGLVAREPESHDWLVGRSGEYVLVLCPGVTVQDAPPAARRLIEEARKLRVMHGKRKLRVTLSIGIAHNHKRPELAYEAFLGVALESLGVAQGAGGNRWVHTELYDMLRRRFPDRAPAAPPVVDSAPVASAAPATSVAPAIPAPAHAAPPTPAVPHGSAPIAPASSTAPPPSTVAPGAVVRIQPGVPAAPSLPPPLEETGPTSETIEILQRRVRKLANALEEAEVEIAALRGEQAEAGVASIYRTVQGLSPDEAFIDLKRKLMSDIYEANRQLQQVSNN
jgi:GGDEF domain-containing protein